MALLLGVICQTGHSTTEDETDEEELPVRQQIFIFLNKLFGKYISFINMKQDRSRTVFILLISSGWGCQYF